MGRADRDLEGESLEISIGGAKLILMRGDITEQDVEAIVNAANPSLMGGGGVDGAIHRKGGPKILEECKRIRATEWPDGLPTGKAVITSGGNLKARYVIHTVGPIWRGGSRGEPELLREAYLSSLRLAASRGIRTIAFPSISTGAYGYPIREASRVALKAIKDFLETEGGLDEVRLVLFTEGDLKVYEEAAKEILGQ
jgi:O-acetyl-ADP-ribose deacetylase (regulator of RNase III)